MPIPQQPRFGEFIRRLFITKEWPSPQVLDDWFPSIDLLSEMPEFKKLRDERTFAGGGQGLGGVATGGRLWCMNKNPSSLATVDGIIFSSTATMGTFFVDLTAIGLPNDAVGGLNTNHSCDSRYGTGLPGTTPQAPVSFANDQSAVPSGVRYVVTQAAGSSSIMIPVRYVLKPGYALAVSTDIQGTGNNIWVTFLGYARGAEDSELK